MKWSLILVSKWAFREIRPVEEFKTKFSFCLKKKCNKIFERTKLFKYEIYEIHLEKLFVKIFRYFETYFFKELEIIFISVRYSPSEIET